MLSHSKKEVMALCLRVQFFLANPVYVMTISTNQNYLCEICLEETSGQFLNDLKYSYLKTYVSLAGDFSQP